MEKRERGFETLIMITTNGCVWEIDNIKKAEISQSGRLVCKSLYGRTLPVTTVAWKTCNQLHLTDLQYSV